MPKATQEEAELLVSKFCKEKGYTFKNFIFKDQYTRITLFCEKHNYEWYPTYKQIKTKIKRKQTKCMYCKNQEAIQPNKLTKDEALYRLLVASDFMQKYIWEDFELESINKTYVNCKCMRCGNEWTSNFGDLTRSRHTLGNGYPDCPSCNNKNPLDELEVKIRVNRFCMMNDYSYRDFVYENNIRQRINLICNKCSYGWDAEINNITQSSTGCKECGKIKLMLSQDEAERKITEVSKGEYYFKPFEYRSISTKITCVCNRCNKEFKNIFSNLIYHEAKCTYCYGLSGISKAEKEIVFFIGDNFDKLEILENKRIIPKPNTKSKLELDIYLPEINLAFEYNGEYWHSDEMIIEKTKGYFKSSDEYHQYKTDKCLEMGIDLIHISEKDYKNDKDKVLNLIKEEIKRRM